MHILIAGLNHKTAPMQIREKFFLNPLEQEYLLSELKGHPQIGEAFVLSTCNRTEIAAHVDEEADARILMDLLFKLKHVGTDSELERHFFVLHELEAVRHLFSVAASVDSMVIGERQILGQLKQAIEMARSKGMLGSAFNRLTQVAVRCGKKVQAETSISQGGSSVGWAAITWASEKLGTLKGRAVLLIGSGKMAAISLKQLQKHELGKITIINRTYERAVQLASGIGAEAVPFSDLKDVLSQVEVCICSVGAPHYLIERETIASIQAKRGEKPLALVDISIPRNIDPRVQELSNIHYCNLDSLQSVVDENMWRRQQAMQDVHCIVEAKIKEYLTKSERSQMLHILK